MAPNVDLTAQSPATRIPKLRYRNPLPAGPEPPTSQNSQDSGKNPTGQEPRPNPDTSPATISHPSLDTTSLTSSSLASLSSSASSSNGSASSKKKKNKAHSVLSFLSLKEPSQVALEQLAEQQRKQNAAKGTSTPQSKSSPNYVGQKLPANVPKVNSKWDGIPSSAKHRYSTSSGSSGSIKDNRSSVSSRGSLGSPLKTTTWNHSKVSVMTDGTRNPPNSIASASVSNFRMEDDSSTIRSSRSVTTLPETSYCFPDAPYASGALPAQPQRAVEAHARASDSTSEYRPSMDDSTASRPDSPASSTSSTDTIVRDTADTIFRKLNATSTQNTKNTWISGAPAVLSPEASGLEYVPESHDFLFNPQPVVERPTNDPPKLYDPPMAQSPVQYYAPSRPVQNFSRPIASRGAPIVLRSAQMAPYRRTLSATALPTLYEASLASTDDLSTVHDEDESRPTTPSTIGPSDPSNHWSESSRERLGLGRRLQINDASPWENQGEPVGKPKKSRLSMFGRSTAKA